MDYNEYEFHFTNGNVTKLKAIDNGADERQPSFQVYESKDGYDYLVNLSQVAYLRQSKQL